MNQTIRYKWYISNFPNVFWNKNSTDKPNRKLFDNFLQLEKFWKELGDISPNFITQFNASIFVDSDDYTYLKCHDTIKDSWTYWFVEGIDKITDNGYVINITMDIFTTYGYDFLDYLKNQVITVVRTTYSKLYWRTPQALLSSDPLLDVNNWPLISWKLDSQYDFDNKITRLYNANLNPNVPTIVTRNCTQTELASVDNLYNDSVISCEIKGFIDGFSEVMQNLIADVYQFADGTFVLVPMFSGSDLSPQSDEHTVMICDITYGDFRRESNAKFANSKDTLDYLKTRTYMVNMYKGRFYIPLFFTLMTTCDWFVFRNIDNQFKAFDYIFSITLGPDINLKWIEKLDTPKVPNIENYYRTFWNRYSDDKPNPYVLSKTCLLDNEEPLFDISTGKLLPYRFIEENVSQVNWNIIFTQNEGIEIFLTTIKFGLGFVIKGYSTFPTNTNSYISYLAQVSSSQDAALTAARNNMSLGIAKNFYSGLSSMVTGGANVAGGNTFMGVGQISKGLSNWTFGVASNILQYQNLERQINAENADKRRSSSANMFLPSVKKHIYSNALVQYDYYFHNTLYPPRFLYPNIYNSIMVRTLPTQLEGIKIKQPLRDLIKYYNNLIWHVGYFINQPFWFDLFRTTYDDALNDSFDDDGTIKDPINGNFFVYWEIEFDQKYVYQKFPKLNKELQDAIYQVVVNPFRLWRQYSPDVAQTFLTMQIEGVK